MLTPWHWALLRLHDGKKQEPVTPTESKQRVIGSCMCFPSAANKEDARGLFCRSKSRTVRLIVMHGSKNCSEKKKRTATTKPRLSSKWSLVSRLAVSRDDDDDDDFKIHIRPILLGLLLRETSGRKDLFPPRQQGTKVFPGQCPVLRETFDPLRCSWYVRYRLSFLRFRAMRSCCSMIYQSAVRISDIILIDPLLPLSRSRFGAG